MELVKEDPDRSELFFGYIRPFSQVYSKQSAPAYITTGHFQDVGYFPDVAPIRNMRQANADTRAKMEKVKHYNARSSTQTRYNALLSGTGTVVPGDREKDLENNTYYLRQAEGQPVQTLKDNNNFVYVMGALILFAAFLAS